MWAMGSVKAHQSTIVTWPFFSRRQSLDDNRRNKTRNIQGFRLAALFAHAQGYGTNNTGCCDSEDNCEAPALSRTLPAAIGTNVLQRIAVF